ncbi:hypothetical protein CY34DRAFT_656104 [Suillus luteus UH-Slu-Lm8-n1]|uniref:Uncharacterized protein n=1 Tax=Suillus luteus UH-Slu-Lm8-n1 TaxID=930992 RepID=A0A0D0A297_9AGAM|nr:hypothetical protein CY34DRAFT_656104 [Suillus luteus UH-Slu-Lm8-n1]
MGDSAYLTIVNSSANRPIRSSLLPIKASCLAEISGRRSCLRFIWPVSSSDSVAGAAIPATSQCTSIQLQRSCKSQA